MPRNKTKVVLTPEQKEVIKAVKSAVCQLYEITEEDLVKNVSDTVAYLRFYTFWILYNNTSISHYALGELFGKSRCGVRYGIEQVEGWKTVMRDTRTQLKMIAETANNYPKKYEWAIQSINITS